MGVLVPTGLLLLVHLVAFSQAFTQNILVRQPLAQWRADRECKDRGYDGLAVVNTPAAWDFVKAVLAKENLESTEKVWIGLEYHTVEGAPQWVRGWPYTWAAWGPDQPDWTHTAVLIAPDGSRGFTWETQGTNYDHLILCGKETDVLKMTKVSNQNVNLSSVTSLVTDTVASVEECGVVCGSVAGCAYFTFAGGSDTCTTYDQAAGPAMLIDSGTPSAFVAYQMAA